jgi:signal transduction histidine kinase
VGWWLAGRSLAPVRGITATARELSEDDLSARVNLAGPDDEIKELADTFDAMLDRIENAFEAYRNFAAVASHELRTPLSVIRVEADNALAEPGSDPEHRKMAGTIQHAVERAESMIEQLMALTRSRSGVLETAPVDLAEVVGEVVGELAPAASAAGLRLDLDLGDADIRGDRVLLRVLADNLVRNAIVHNQPGGWVRVAVGTAAGRAMVSVVNSGRRYLPEDVARMLVPFERVGSDRTRGSGLGLPAAQAIVEAHHGSLSATPPREGGLEVVVSLPTMAAPAVSAP